MFLLSKKSAGLLMGGILFLSAGSGQALISPEHYEKLKKEAQGKTREAEKPQPPAPGKIQVHLPDEGQAPIRKLNPK
jgi:hypothetical protein